MQIRDGEMTLDDIEKELAANNYDDLGDLNAVGGTGRGKPAAEKKVDIHKLKGTDLRKAVADRYGINLKKNPRAEVKKPVEVVEEPIDADLEQTTLRRSFKYFLYHKHSLLGVCCVAYGAQLPRYARLFLFLFDLCCQLMFALTFKAAGFDIGTRIFLTVFLCLAISFFMGFVFRKVGYNKMIAGRGCCSRLFTIGLLMVIPSAIVLPIIFVYLGRTHDGGEDALIFFCITTSISLVMEIVLWYFVYDCCQAYCSCFLWCCPNLLDDAEVAQDDIAHAKKKARKHKKRFDDIDG